MGVCRHETRKGGTRGSGIEEPADRPSLPPLAVFHPSFSRSHHVHTPYQPIIPPIVRRSGILSHTLRPPRLAGVATGLLVTFVGSSNTCVRKHHRVATSLSFRVSSFVASDIVSSSGNSVVARSSAVHESIGLRYGKFYRLIDRWCRFEDSILRRGTMNWVFCVIVDPKRSWS